MGAFRFIASLLLVATGAFAGAVPARAAPLPNPSARKQLESELGRIAQIGRRHARRERGATSTAASACSCNAAERYPMASTFKVAVAVKLLDEVDRGRLTLDDTGRHRRRQREPRQRRDQAHAPGRAEERQRGRAAGLHDARERQHRDRSPARARGRPGAVALHLRNLGIDEMDVSRTDRATRRRRVGLHAAAARESATGRPCSRCRTRAGAGAPGLRARASSRIARDTTTPDAMVALLELPAARQGAQAREHRAPARSHGELPHRAASA